MLLLLACYQDATPKNTGPPLESGVVTDLYDGDGDGYNPSEGDCNDEDASINPGATELCDGVDQDCDGQVDDGLESTSYQDADGDGYGDPATATTGCEEGGVDNGEDCNDSDPAFYPGAPESCTDPYDYNCDGSLAYEDSDGDGFAACEECDDSNAAINPAALEICDGLDNDCNGLTDDEDPGISNQNSFYVDADGDGYGDTEILACFQPEGSSTVNGDCDDTNALFNPGALEDCTDPTDYNCDGSVGYQDGDGDGFTACEECDDTNAAIYPGGVEICDGLDNNCSGSIDETVTSTFYADTDGDGYGDAGSSLESCSQPGGYVGDSTDCDDGNGGVNPGELERCDGLDNDCDGSTDEEAVDASVWYEDADGDGFGGSIVVSDCTKPSGYVADSTDCNDGDVAINPIATELCDGLDNNCDGIVDSDAVDQSVWYLDADGDGFGDTALSSCTQPSGYSSQSGDCDDSDALTYPGATELCTDPVDRNCDGVFEFVDGDGDGVAACEDCDDGNSSVYPGAIELCNGVDDNCDGVVDSDAVDRGIWYADGDGDGFGDFNNSQADCTQPAGFVGDSSDCDDSAATINPLETEVCNGLDDNCDGVVDVDAVDRSDWHLDSDCDGFGEAFAVSSCSAPSSDYLADGSDCNDLDGRDFLGGLERCDGLDNDCDGLVDESCATPLEIPAPAYPEISSPAEPSACARIVEVSLTTDPHNYNNLPTFMTALEGGNGYVSGTEVATDILDWSIRCYSSYSASKGNYTSTTSWPVLSPQGSQGAGRFRGYIHIGCGEELNRTIGLIGNDSLTLTIGGVAVLSQNWNNGQWKTFRYVTFPEPGLYPFEVQWSTNLNCNIDPFELVWAEGFITGYDNYKNMCNYATCTYGDHQPIPYFSVVDGTNLTQSTTGAATSCEQCTTTADCSLGVCNSAGICEY